MHLQDKWPVILTAVSLLLGLSLFTLWGRSGRESGPVPGRLLLLNLAALLTFAAAVGGTMYFLHGVLELPKAYWVVPIFGALGGFAGCLFRNGDQIPLVTFDRFRPSIRLGFVGDMVLGLGGASAIVFLFENTLRFDPEQTSSYPLLISVCFVAGVFGRLVVQEAGQKMVKEALHRVDKAEQQVEKLIGPSTMAYILESREQYKIGRFSEALFSAEKALQIDPQNIRAMNSKARALKQLGRVPEAFQVIGEAVRAPRGHDQISTENYGVLLYNKVCYGTRLGALNEDEAISALKECFAILPRLQLKAAGDEDLTSLHQNERFKRLISVSGDAKE